MADKSIEQLNPAERVNLSDLFVLQQSGTAKKLTGQVLKNWLLELAQGHGGITSIALQSTSGLNKTYRITLADDTFFDMTVADGKGITSVSKTGTSGLVDTYTMKFNAGSDFVFTVKNGEKGDKGDADRLYFKFASQKPTDASHSMGDVPDEWLGFYAGTTAPTGWQDYTWVRVRGDKGDKGDPATLTGHSTTYMVSDSGTIAPSGSWVADVPSVPQGKFLWTRTVLNFNSGNPVTSYSVSRFGLDGTGAVSSVNGKDPDPTGNVRVNAEDITTTAGQSVQAALDAAVKTVNGKEPDEAGAVTLEAEDVHARPDTWTPTAAEVGAVAKSDVLTAEEIEASTDLTGKVAGAEAVKSLNEKMFGIATTTIDFWDYFNGRISLFRVGNMVFANVGDGDCSNVPAGSSVTHNAVPIGFRPLQNHTFWTAASCKSFKIQFSVDANGDVHGYNYEGETTPTPRICRFETCWATGDKMPGK